MYATINKEVAMFIPPSIGPIQLQLTYEHYVNAYLQYLYQNYGYDLGDQING